MTVHTRRHEKALFITTLGLALLAAGPWRDRAAAQTPPADSTAVEPAAADAPGPTAGPVDVQARISELNARVLANPADGRAWNDLGVIYAGQDDMNLARDCFIRAVQTAPKEADYHRNLGVAFSRLGDYDIAVAEFEAYRRFDTLGGTDYWRLIGEAQRRAGRDADARATFNEGLAALGPDRQAERLRLAVGLLQIAQAGTGEQEVRDVLQEHAAEAAAFLQGLARDDEPGAAEAHLIVDTQVAKLVEDGALLEQSALPGEAAQVYRKAFALAPDRVDLLPKLVDAYLADGKELEAGTAVQVARESHADKPGTWIAAAKIQEHAGELAGAVDAYKQAYALDPSLPGLQLAIGNLLLRLGRDAEASDFLREGVDTAGASPELVYNYAVSLIRANKFNAAIPPLRNVLQERPQMGQAWLGLAQCLQATGRFAQAVEPFRKAYELNPDPKFIFQAGACAHKAGLYDEAVDAYRTALAADSTYVKAQANLTLVLMDAKRYEEAAPAFDRLIALEGGTYRSYFSQGLAYYYLEDYPKAITAYEMALELQETADVCNNMGLVYDKMGDKLAAQKWYKLAKEMQAGS